MDKKRPKKSAGRRCAPVATTEPTFRREGSWKKRSSSVLWLKLNFTIKAARLQSLKRQKYQHLQEEALLKARGLLKNWEDGPVLLTEDLYSRARTEHEAQELLNYTPEALALRFSLRNHPDVVDAVKQLWSVELPRDEMGCIDQHGYASLFRRIGRSLEPEATKRRRRRMEKTIQEDWIRDSKGEPAMGFANFFDSVFELADLWCESIDVDEYIAFLRRLVLRVSTVRRAKHDPSSEARRLLRPLKQIKAIDNEEESSSSEELSPSEADDEELVSDGSSGDDDEEEDNLPVQLPPPVTPIHSLGFIATKALQTMRARTPSAGSTREVQEINNVPEPVQNDRPRSRERRASIITLGDFGLGGLGTLGGFSGGQGNDEEADPKTPTGLRVASAKSRTTSAKRKPLTSVHENGSGAANEDDGGVNALIAMHRSRSAQPRTPIVVEDGGPSGTILNNEVHLNVGLPMPNLPQQRQQRPAKLVTGAFGAPKPGIGVGSVSMDGLPSPGLHSAGALTSSAPRLKTPTGLASGTFGDVDTARVGSGGARRAMLSQTKAKQKGEKKPAGIVFEGASQEKDNNRLAALNVKSSGSPNHSDIPQNSNQDLANRKTLLAEGEEEQLLQSSMTDTQSAAAAPREYISGFGLDSPAIGAAHVDTSTMRKRSGIMPVNASLPFYTFDENASPAKRLLPPVLGDTGDRGRSEARSGKTRRQGSANGRSSPNGPDFSESYKKTAYLTGSLQAHILAQTQWSVSGSRNGRPTPQSETPLWFPFPGKESKSPSRRSTSKQTPKRMRKLSPDDGYGDVTVSPWDTEFDDDHDDDLGRAFPRIEKRWELPAPSSPIVQPEPPMHIVQDSEIPVIEPPTLSVSSSMVPSEPPSCVSELTTLPQEYHELVLGGSALNYHKGLGRTESAPVAIAPTQDPVTHTVKRMSREPRWMLHGTSQPSLTLLEHGVEGLTVADSSPRSIFTALASKRPRRERDVDEEADTGLCPRFVEHLESHGERAATANSPLFRTDKPKPRCTCNDFLEGANDGGDDQEAQSRCPRHGSNNNNWQEDDEEQEEFLLEQDAVIEDVTVIVNATRGLVLRPGTMDKLAAKRARYKQHATRSEMMRRRCQYTFAKHLG